MFKQASMLSKPASRVLSQKAFMRNFQSSARSMNKIYGTPAEGPYSNLPFKVHNRRFIPFGVYYWGVLGFFFAFPFLTTYLHLYKSGALNE